MKMLAINQTNRIISDSLLVEYHIFDLNAPVIITFSPAGYLLTTKEVDQGKTAWGFTLFKKMKVNVIAFSAINEKHWFATPEIEQYIKDLSPQLVTFPERLGYGASMGAFAVTFYATELKLDRLFLITPMAIPEQVNNDITFQYAADFNGEITLIYDPFCPLDKSCALQYPKKTQYLRFYGVGHQVIESLCNISYLKKLVIDFINNAINLEDFAKHSRKRKNLERYYSYLKRNPTKKNSKQRKQVILIAFIKWNLRHPADIFKKQFNKTKKSLRRRGF